MLPVSVLIRTHNSRQSRLFPAVLSFCQGVRFHATHKDAASSPLLTQQLDLKSRAVWQRSDVGPFQLGGIQSNRDEKFKKWQDLNASGKVLRTTARTSNLIVIIFGAGLSVMLVYALATELFAPNSPTVLYNEACEKVKTSSEVLKYLRGPLRFHTSPPTLGRPQHRNRGVTHQLSYDSQGREHLLFNFYVSSGNSLLAAESELSLIERISTWGQSFGLTLQQWTLADVKISLLTLWHRSSDYSKHIFRVLTNQRSPPPTQGSPFASPPPLAPPAEAKYQEYSTGWGFASLFANVRRRKTVGSSEPQSPNMKTDWDEAEVHADLIRNSEGKFIWRYLLVDIPHSRVQSPIRIFVERDTGVSRTEAVPHFRF